MSATRVLYVGNTNYVELDALTNEVTGVVITDASVTLRLKDAAGADVAGETWPLVLTHVADGLYRCYLVSTLPLVADAKYTGEVVAIAGGSLVGKWSLDFVAKVRR